MILLNENNQVCSLFNVTTHFCECGTVQSGHLKSPARTKVNIYKIIFPKNKGTFIILMTVVIQYANAYFNLKNQDLRSNAFVETKTVTFPGLGAWDGLCLLRLKVWCSLALAI